MTYTKDNIDGIEFTYKGEGESWTIVTNGSYVLSRNGTKSGFVIDEMVMYLNTKLWIPIVEKETVYEIY